MFSILFIGLSEFGKDQKMSEKANRIWKENFKWEKEEKGEDCKVKSASKRNCSTYPAWVLQHQRTTPPRISGSRQDEAVLFTSLVPCLATL